jgi:hypothetical protein
MSLNGLSLLANNSRRGFETMKTVWSVLLNDAQLIGCVAAVLTLTSRCERRAGAKRLRNFAGAKRIAAPKTRPKRITAVDNVMTQV